MSPADRPMATVIDLEARRPTPIEAAAPISSRPGGVGKTPPAGLLHRVTHSPAAADLRDHGWAVGLLLTAIVLLLIKGLS